MMNNASCSHVTQSYQQRQPKKRTHSYLRAPSFRVMSDMADRIRRARIAAGFDTATEAAERLGMKPHAYRHYESGYRTPPTSRLADMARAFRVDMDWLVSGKGGQSDASAEIVDIWDRISEQDKPAALQVLKSLAASSNKT